VATVEGSTGESVSEYQDVVFFVQRRVQAPDKELLNLHRWRIIRRPLQKDESEKLPCTNAGRALGER
jgi:hypothetical protein